MPVTIRDIARKLNLSIAAVSRALDGYPDISEETRQRVLTAAREMGYVPNRAARQLRRRRSDTLGYILPAYTPRFADPFFSEFIAGLGDEAASRGYDLLVSSAAPDQAPEQEIYRTWVQGHKVDGLVLNRIRLHDWRVTYLAGETFPFVGLEHSRDGIDYPRVEVDNRAGFAKLVEHVAGRGFSRIAYLGGPVDLRIQSERLAGYRDGLRRLGLEFEANLVLRGDLTANTGYELARGLLARADRPDAILCVNDETAFGVLHAAHEHGLRIGLDLAVSGFDGVISSGHTSPPLTTLNQPVYDIARQLVAMLVRVINQEELDETCVQVPLALLARESTGGAQA